MYPDIIMITEANVGISSKTLESVAKHAPHSAYLLKPNTGINREAGEFLQNERLSVLKKSTSDYVLIMDDDDELVGNVPSADELDGHNVIFYNYRQDNGPARDFRTCRPTQIFVFCGVIVKKEIAVKGLEYTVKQKCLREDIGFFYFIMKNISNVYFSEKVLINKIGQREPKRNQWLRAGFRNEFDLVWRDRISEIRGNKI